MAGSSEDKTLPASAKKLREARKKGQVAKSKDFVTAAVTLAAIGCVMTQWGQIAAHFAVLIGHAGDLVTRPLAQALPPLASEIAEVALRILAPLLAGILAAAILSSVIATGGPAFSLDPIVPKPQKLNPAEGIKKIVSTRGLVEVAKSLLKLALLGAIAWQVVRASLQQMVELPACGLQCSGMVLRGSLLPLAMAGAAVFAVFGLADLGLQRWLFMRDQRMSHTERKNEHKNSEGNPLVKSAHRRERREASNLRAGLNQASFVITGAKLAVAMRYNAVDTKVPTVVARVEDADVTEFVQEARRLKLPLLHDPETARMLHAKVPVGHSIPQDLFTPVIMAMKRLGMLG
ncbi:type III secretion protein U [Endobacter medicaginis]|uniref:EscU/YscU/HrcU family type III secretion system export apparatus switch protein n=1 Tax=Endobacter medicaginis TaxID=1181271 RepID=A0A850NLW9_9PROT|nr:EscU/YscU/HrcU family type III secretion system export apparatus switch protein [Endobacter medicaginis]MBB3175274.1 type III secretion protein U [Endobacter medicaginis]MCX5476942.1 EscU/YscU/HrcU family type III secretion system export apparatus switch protein [Endobacter medicaginis]NVN29439.1 EscU/YscU/HrcU family type III secretion system export apparatus switch protein [Endobacter medicaginis]